MDAVQSRAHAAANRKTMFFKKKTDCQTLQYAAGTCRPVCALNRKLPLPAAEAAVSIGHAVRHAPPAFNSQSVRLPVLFGTEREKLWDITENAFL